MLGVWVRGASGAKHPSARRSRAGEGAGRGSPLPATGVGGVTPGKFLKFQMPNPAFWCTLVSQNVYTNMIWNHA